MESKLDHSRLSDCCSLTLGIQFMFEGIHQRLKGNGGEVSKLMLELDEESEANRNAFNEMLISVASAPFDAKKLTHDERATLNNIILYLTKSTEVNAVETINKGGEGEGAYKVVINKK